MIDLARSVKHRLRPFYRRGRRGLAQVLHRYGPSELSAALGALGLTAGDTVLLHSGFHDTSGFRGTAADVIACLRETIGVRGNLMMMSIPYRGASEAWAARNPVFDVRRTPSAVGLISEIFRRQPDTVRSLSPLHPVLAAGPLAKWLTEDHEKSPCSCGRGSPLERFLRRDGKVVFYDAPYRSMTFMHYVEDRFRERLPLTLYADAPVRLRVLDNEGRESVVKQQVFSREAREQRRFDVVERALIAGGALRRQRVGNSTLLCVAAADVVDCAARLLDDGPGFFDAGA